MKNEQLVKIKAGLESRGMEILDIRLEHAQGGFYVVLREGGVRFARGTYLIEYGGHFDSCAVLYLRKRCIPVGHGYVGRGWIERFCEDLARIYNEETHALTAK